MSPADAPQPETNAQDPDGEFPLEPQEYLFYLLFQAARQRDAYCDRELTPIGLNMAQWRSLAIIRRIEGCTMSLLARYSTIDRTTLTRSVDQLIARGLVERWTPERDRRQVNLALTVQGEAVFERAAAVLKVRNEAVLADVAPQRLVEAMRVLQAAPAELVDHRNPSHDPITFVARGTACP